MKAIAEAPSKVIITGEHFVVHGAWALAAAVPKTVRVETAESEEFKVVSDRFPRSDAQELRPAGAVVEYLSREYSVSPKVTVRVSSGVPQGAGLGSSAATLVALASAFARLRGLKLTVDEVVKASMVGESMVHGNPSGIDPNICARGGVILFRPGSAPKKIKVGSPRSILISYSGIARSTKHQISRVADMKKAFPNYFSRLVDSIGDLSKTAAALLKEGDMKGLGSLLCFNQAVLSSVGVSTEVIDEMVDRLILLGCYGAKLTGGGGGGSVLAVGPEAKEKSIVSGLKARGFETFSVKVPVAGVRSWRSR